MSHQPFVDMQFPDLCILVPVKLASSVQFKGYSSSQFFSWIQLDKLLIINAHLPYYSASTSTSEPNKSDGLGPAHANSNFENTLWDIRSFINDKLHTNGANNCNDLVFMGDWNESMMDACGPVVGDRVLKVGTRTSYADGSSVNQLIQEGYSAKERADRRRRRELILSLLADFNLRVYNTQGTAPEWSDGHNYTWTKFRRRGLPVKVKACRYQRQLDFIAVPQRWYGEAGTLPKSVKSTDHHPILYKAISKGEECNDPCIPGLAWEPAKKDYPFTGWEPLTRSDLHAYRKQIDVNFKNMQNHMDGDEQILSRTIDDIIGVACTVNHTTKGLKNWQLNQPTVRERSLLVTVKCHPEDEAAATELKALKKSRLDQRAKEKVRSCSTKRAQHALPDRLLFEGKEEFNRDIWSDHLFDYMCKRFKEDHCDNGLEVQCARVERAWLRATIHGTGLFGRVGRDGFVYIICFGHFPAVVQTAQVGAANWFGKCYSSCRFVASYFW